MSRLLQGHFTLLSQSKLLRGIHSVNQSLFNQSIKNDTSFLKFILSFSFEELWALIAHFDLTTSKRKTLTKISNPHYRWRDQESEINNLFKEMKWISSRGESRWDKTAPLDFLPHRNSLLDRIQLRDTERCTSHKIGPYHFRKSVLYLPCPCTF